MARVGPYRHRKFCEINEERNRIPGEERGTPACHSLNILGDTEGTEPINSFCDSMVIFNLV